LRTAIDSSVILDVITQDPQWAESSAASIRQAMRSGSLILGECVLAEITPVFKNKDLRTFLSDWGITFVPSSIESSHLAGTMYLQYLNRKGTSRRVLPDFLIGAHARCHADRLLARDRGYYRDYFTDLLVIEPSKIL
jgi:predicted nucleic acid-binding protein